MAPFSVDKNTASAKPPDQGGQRSGSPLITGCVSIAQGGLVWPSETRSAQRTGRERLGAQAEQLRLTNVQFLPSKPRVRLPEVLAATDISLVTLRQGVGVGSLPSKTFSILASECPVLASVDEGNGTWNLWERAEASFYVLPKKPARLAAAGSPFGDGHAAERIVQIFLSRL